MALAYVFWGYGIMKGRNQYGALVLGLLLFSACNPMAKDVKPTIIRSNGPESIKQARQHLTIDLPDSGKTVQYLLYYEWQAVEELVRFQASVDDCRATAETIIAKYNSENPKHLVAGLRRLDSTWRDRTQPRPPTNTGALSAVWFDPQTIRAGLVGGDNGSHKPRIWIDTERGVFYYLYTD